MKVETLKQFSVFLPNKPGALSRLAKLFADAGVNLLGIASEVRDDSGMVRIAVGQDKDVSAVLSKAGFASVESKLLSVVVADKPGELLRVSVALAEGGVNITTVYGTSLDGQSCRILFAAENTEKALEVLARLA